MTSHASGQPVAERSLAERPATGVLLALCVTVTISYGVLYYAFTVLAPDIATTTGWSHAAVTIAFSVGSLVGAGAGIVVGRRIQRHGPRELMVVGALLGAGAVVLIALAPSYAVFVLAWVIAGAATAGLYYAPAFAALTRWYGERRVEAITSLTLVAGFASTIFAPLTSYLDATLGWRGTYLAYAALLLAVNAPAHAFVLRHPWHLTPVTRAERRAPAADRTIVTSRPFLLLVAAGTLTSLAEYASLVNFVPLFTGRGMSPHLAAWALGIGGAGQVAGRLAYPWLTRRLDPTRRTVAVIVLLAATLLALAVLPGPAGLLFALSILSGAARGLFTLVIATLVADHWGTERYAALNGTFNAPLTAAGALAPGLGAALAAATGSYPLMFGALGVVSLLAAGLAAASGSVRFASPIDRHMQVAE